MTGVAGDGVPAKQTFTITFGDQAENNVGMQKIGSLSTKGFDLNDLTVAQNWFQQKGAITTLYDLKSLLPSDITQADDAHLLVIKGGLSYLLPPSKTINDFYAEQDALEKDKKAFMYGRVVNKVARHNLCFGTYNQEPDYEQGQGRIVSFDDVPLLNTVRNRFVDVIGDKGNNLVAEGNYYYDINKCYISYHGDTERKKVIAIRVGQPFPLYYQWYHQSKPVGDCGELMLDSGDIYIMSEKATGNDWKRRTIYTLRHAAGFNL